LVAVPQVLLNGLSDWPTTTDARHHYIAAVIPFLVAASVLGVARLRENRRTGVATVMAAVALGFTLILGPWPGLPEEGPVGFHAKLPAEHVAALREAESLVPGGAPVSATNIVGSRLSARRYFYSVPVLGKAGWIVLDTWNSWMPRTATRSEGRHPDVLSSFHERIERDPAWRKVFEKGGVLVFKKASPA
jgi:uncharacterized membrane protein